MRRSLLAAHLLAVLIAGLGAAACGDILGVEAAGQVDASELSKPENASLMVTGAIADFECALSGYIVNQGLLGNELQDASITAARFSLDRRDLLITDPYGLNPCNASPPGVYRPVATARWSADNAVTLLDGWTDDQVPNRTRLIGQVSAYAGYSLVLLGEGFCTAVIEENGPEVQPDDAFTAAVARFGRAIGAAQAASDAQTETLALLGRARANLNLENLTAAADDARAALAKSANFAIVSSASSASTRRYFRLGEEFNVRLITVDPSYRGLTTGGEPDPRVNVVNTNLLGADSQTPVWLATKVGASISTALRNVSWPIATWREAHLIIAEAEGGQEAVNRINILRTAASLPAFASTDANAIRQQVIEERSRELFLEGHHVNDLRRFNLPFAQAAGTQYRQGGVYGDQRCFQLPAIERDNNPNIG